MSDSPALSEQAELAERESRIATGLETFQQVGNDLLAIRDKKLYLLTEYATWDAYLAGKWNITRSYASRLMSAANTATALPNGNLIKNEYQARILAEYDPTLRSTIALIATARANTEQREVTATDFRVAGEVVSTAAVTGGVDLGDGTITPLDAALTQEQVEIVVRQHGHIRGKGKKRTYIVTPTPITVRQVTDVFGKIQMTVIFEGNENTAQQLFGTPGLNVSVWTEGE